MKHQIVRIKQELKTRVLTVRRAERLTPHMQRITLGGEGLAGFTSAGPDDHVKVLVPSPSETTGRFYTVRRYDENTSELTLDFALHEAGPATAWARSVVAGQTIQIAGPRGSTIIPTDFDWWLFVGDETALPAIGRYIEELPPGTRVSSIVAVGDPDDEQTIDTEANHRAVWVHRAHTDAHNPEPLRAALANETMPVGDGYIWIAAESGVARALRHEVLGVGQHPLAWTKVSGYWTKGKADASEKFDR